MDTKKDNSEKKDKPEINIKDMIDIIISTHGG